MTKQQWIDILKKGDKKEILSLVQTIKKNNGEGELKRIQKNLDEALLFLIKTKEEKEKYKNLFFVQGYKHDK